jgi:hypothetical protein
MLRHFYRYMIRLHPSRFRRRFGEEMLSIFDEAQSRKKVLGLMVDGIASLSRQWILRPEFWSDAALPVQPAVDGIPAFGSLDPFRPRATAVMQGAVLSITLFSLTCFAIRYSWIHILHVRIPETQFESAQSIHPGASPSELRGATSKAEAKNSSRPALSDEEPSSERLKVDVLPVEAAPAWASTEASDTNAQQVASASPQPSGSAIHLEINLEAYAGTYFAHSSDSRILIDIKDDNLVMTAGNKPARMLSPLSETSFLLSGNDGSWIRFDREHGRRFQQLHLFQGGQETVAQRH